MAGIVLPNRFAQQPQYPALLNKSHPLAKNTTLFLNGATPQFNSANGKILPVTAGGSGYSQRATPLGTSLYTPNGGWADVAVAEDWIGPNTVIAICRVNSIDSPYGGLFAKNSIGNSTQLAVGRDNATSSLYGAVEDSTAVGFGGASIPALVDFSVLAFTHSGVASTAMSYSRNGALVGSTTALGTQGVGNGVLGLGRERGSNASFDSDVDWVAFVRVARVLSASEIAVYVSNPSNIWAMLQAPARRLWVVPAAATGIVAITGQALTSAQGILTPSLSKTLTGQSLTSAQGTLTPGTAKTLAGQALTSAQGTLAPSISVAITGQALTSAQGTLSANGAVTIALSGQTLTSAQGTLAPSAAVAITGQSLTSAQGSVSPATSVALSGQALTSSQGTLTPSATGQSITIQLTGQSLTSGQGSLSLDQYIWDTTQGRAQPGRGTFKPLKPNEMSKPEIVVVDIPEEESTYEHHTTTDVSPVQIGPRAGLAGVRLPRSAPRRAPTQPQAQARDYKALMLKAGTVQKTRKLSDFKVQINKKYLTKTRGPVTLKGN